MSVAERTAALLDRLRAKDSEALGELFMLYRDRLWRILYVRLDRRLASRVTPDDVLQETFLDVASESRSISPGRRRRPSTPIPCPIPR